MIIATPSSIYLLTGEWQQLLRRRHSAWNVPLPQRPLRAPLQALML
jgi:hypothetical protein